MNVTIVNASTQSIGGGWSFIENFQKKCASEPTITFTPIKDADLVLLPSSSMIPKDLLEWVKSYNKPVVLRVDNIPRNSRNRNTGTSNMQRCAQAADLVVYQSQWAKDYIAPFLGKDGPVIHNSVDEDIFRPDGPTKDYRANHSKVYLYSRYSRDETKCWEKAWYEYQRIQMDDPQALLVIVGRFSSEVTGCNFDFFRGEQFVYEGVAEEPKLMAHIMRGCDSMLATYYNDACSNTYVEALLCGVTFEPHLTDLSGGTKEILDCFEHFGPRYFHLDRMYREYVEVMEGML